MYRRPLLSCPPRALTSMQQTRSFRFGVWYCNSRRQRERELIQKLEQRRAELQQGMQNKMQEAKDSIERGTSDLFGRRWISSDAPRYGDHRASTGSQRYKNAESADFLTWPAMVFWGKRYCSTTGRKRGNEMDHEKESESSASDKFVKEHSSELYEYDPVSNRMVPAQSSTVSKIGKFPRKVPFNTFEGYRSHFSNLKPPSLNPADAHEPVIDPELPPQKEELDRYEPFKYNEPDGKAPEELAAATENAPSGEELKKYKAFHYNEPDGHAPEKEDPISKSLKEYDSKAEDWDQKLPVNDCETSYIGSLEHPESGKLSRMLESSSKQRRERVQSVLDPDFPFDADKYKSPYKYNEPDGQSPETNKAAKARSADLVKDVHKYQGSFLYNEPDGHPPNTADPVTEALNEYDPKPPTYCSFRSDSEVEKRPEVIIQLVKERLVDFRKQVKVLYAQYSPEVEFANPGSSDFPEAEIVLKQRWADRGFYNDEGEWNFYRHYSNANGVLTPYRFSYDYDGCLWISPRPEDSHLFETGESADAIIASGDFPNDAYKYQGAYRHNEPDGHAPENPDPVAEGLKEYEQRSKGMEQKRVSRSYPSDEYEREFGSNEQAEDVDDYVKRLRDYPSSATAAKRESLPEKKPVIDEPLPTAEELRSYNAYRYQEPHGRAPETKEMRESRLRKRDRYLEDLKNYKPFKYNEPDGKTPGDPREALKEFDSRSSGAWLAREGFSSARAAELETAFDCSQSKPMNVEIEIDDKAEDLHFFRTSDIRAASGDPKSMASRKETDAEKEHRRKALEDSFLKTPAPGADVTVKKPTTKKLFIVHEASYKPMTGNFVRDFPEEFGKKWSDAGSTLVPADAQAKSKENEVQREENSYVAGLASQEAYARSGSHSSRIQPSLDRSRVSTAPKIDSPDASRNRKLQAQADPYSREPQGLEISYAKEIGERDPTLFVSNYRLEIAGKDEAGEEKSVRTKWVDLGHEAIRTNISTRESDSTLPQVPALYRILAFEPSSQSIKIARTTSIAPENANPVSAPEVLMRLSNPTKFFPHFEPLKAEGYEIVSGGGDILVFKKVRPSDEEAAIEERARIAEEQRAARNPVDAVKPATGNFASPTGFVNHDLPASSSSSKSSQAAAAVSETTPTPSPSSSSAPEKAKSSSAAKSPSNPRISEREKDRRIEAEEVKEEGKKTHEKKEMGRGMRVLVGALGLGGATYATGVVAEWLRTGGADGSGTDGRF